MTNQVSNEKRTKHTAEYKQNALKLAEKIGFSKAAKELDLHSSQLYQWRTSIEKKATTSERESKLANELAILKRQLATQNEELQILKKAATYFAKNQK